MKRQQSQNKLKQKDLQTKITGYDEKQDTFKEEFEDNMDLIIAQLDFDEDIDEDESNPIKKNINTVDFETKMNALKQYNSIIDK